MSTDQDFAEAMEIVEAVQQGRPHQPVEMRHLHAVVNWGARLEQEVMGTEPVCTTEEEERLS